MAPAAQFPASVRCHQWRPLGPCPLIPGVGKSLGAEKWCLKDVVPWGPAFPQGQQSPVVPQIYPLGHSVGMTNSILHIVEITHISG